MSTLWNTYSFFVLYANIDGFSPVGRTLDPAGMCAMDRWLLSRLHSLVRTVDGHLGNYRIPEAAHALDDFVDELSNWYVRRCRERYWAGGMEQDKIDAYMTLYTTLVTLAKLAAPMVPFMAEEIYRNLVCSVDKQAPESVHLCDYPTCCDAWIDPELEADMEEVLRAVILGRACRQAANVKTRQPLARLYLKGDKPLPDFCRDIIAEELNVHEVVLTDDVSAFTSYAFKPQLKTVGPKYGRWLGEIKAALAAIDGQKAMAELNQTGSISLPLSDGSAAVLTDTGYITQEAAALLPGVDAAILEANHEVESLLSGPYPESLKSRILGPRGHLSNEDSARVAVALAQAGARDIILAHLSAENNTPAMALRAVETALRASGLSSAVEVAPRDRLGPLHVLQGRTLCRK